MSSSRPSRSRTLVSCAVALVCLVLATAFSAGHSQEASAKSVIESTDAHVRIGVLGLFHARELVVEATSNSALVLHAGEQSVVLESTSGIRSAHIRMADTGVVVFTGNRSLKGREIDVSARDGSPADFTISIPNKIRRRYRGVLEITARDSGLVPVVRMDLETAVASVTAAESSPGTPIEALKAQAVAARSYLIAGRGRHDQFDFCDTTHCQFLREIPARQSPAFNAAVATRGLVLFYDAGVLAAMYSRSCSGRTHTPTELRLPRGSYPYYSVECAYCRTHPARWTTRIPRGAALELAPLDERSRLEFVRRFGWSTVPSNDFVSVSRGDFQELHGTGVGHGIGLCQAGARAMADTGASFQQILDHYFPNSTVASWSGWPQVTATPK